MRTLLAPLSIILKIVTVFAANLILLYSTSAPAQVIAVNGANCPTAQVSMSAYGVMPILPGTCSGNGNPCQAALEFFELADVFEATVPKSTLEAARNAA